MIILINQLLMYLKVVATVTNVEIVKFVYSQKMI